MCVAAPIVTDAVLAALSVAGPVNRFHPHRHADAVRTAATDIAATLHRRATTKGAAG